MDITFFKIKEKKPTHDQKCWCREKNGNKFIGKYCENCDLFVDLSNNFPVNAHEWTFIM